MIIHEWLTWVAACSFSLSISHESRISIDDMNKWKLYAEKGINTGTRLTLSDALISEVGVVVRGTCSPPEVTSFGGAGFVCHFVYLKSNGSNWSWLNERVNDQKSHADQLEQVEEILVAAAASETVHTFQTVASLAFSRSFSCSSGGGGASVHHFAVSAIFTAHFCLNLNRC